MEQPDILTHVLIQVRRRIADHQAILYILRKPENQRKFNPDPQLLKAIESGDTSFVRNWFRGDLDSLSLSELRDAAKRCGVVPVFGKTKSELILAILEKQDV